MVLCGRLPTVRCRTKGTDIVVDEHCPLLHHRIDVIVNFVSLPLLAIATPANI